MSSRLYAMVSCYYLLILFISRLHTSATMIYVSEPSTDHVSTAIVEKTSNNPNGQEVVPKQLERSYGVPLTWRAGDLGHVDSWSYADAYRGDHPHMHPVPVYISVPQPVPMIPSLNPTIAYNHPNSQQMQPNSNAVRPNLQTFSYPSRTLYAWPSYPNVWAHLNSAQPFPHIVPSTNRNALPAQVAAQSGEYTNSETNPYPSGDYSNGYTGQVNAQPATISGWTN